MDNYKNVSLWINELRGLVDFEKNGMLKGTTIDKWEFYDKLQKHFEEMPNYISPDSNISKNVEIRGKVIIERDVSILPFSVITGPVYIGKNVIIGNYSFIRPRTFISNDALIGNHCYCNEALIGCKVRVSHFCGISRSILERNATVSAFVLTTTLKADRSSVNIRNNGDFISYDKRGCIIGENTYLAPHVNTSPGIAIGKNSFVGSFVFVHKNIPDNKRYRLNYDFKLDENPISFKERVVSKKGIEEINSTSYKPFDRYYSGVILLSSKNELILQRRENKPEITNAGKISTFGGMAFGGELANECAIREIEEELDYRLDKTKLIFFNEIETQLNKQYILCSYFYLLDVDVDKLFLKEGEKIEIIKMDEVLGSTDLTELTRNILSEFLSYMKKK